MTPIMADALRLELDGDSVPSAATTLHHQYLIHLAEDVVLVLSDDQAAALVLAIVRAGMTLDRLIDVHRATLCRAEDYSDDGFAMLGFDEHDPVVCCKCLRTSFDEDIHPQTFMANHACERMSDPDEKHDPLYQGRRWRE